MIARFPRNPRTAWIAAIAAPLGVACLLLGSAAPAEAMSAPAAGDGGGSARCCCCRQCCKNCCRGPARTDRHPSLVLEAEPRGSGLVGSGRIEVKVLMKGDGDEKGRSFVLPMRGLQFRARSDRKGHPGVIYNLSPPRGDRLRLLPGKDGCSKKAIRCGKLLEKDACPKGRHPKPSRRGQHAGRIHHRSTGNIRIL